MKIGIRIKITEETEEFSHYLFEIYAVDQINENLMSSKDFTSYISNIIDNAIKLALKKL